MRLKQGAGFRETRCDAGSHELRFQDGMWRCVDCDYSASEPLPDEREIGDGAGGCRAFIRNVCILTFLLFLICAFMVWKGAGQ